MLTNIYKYLIITSILMFTCFYTVSYKPREVSSQVRLLNIPDRIADWHKVKDLTISQDAYAALDPNSLTMREYSSGKGDPLLLCIVYHKNDRWGAHNPQVCYKSQGWQVMDTKTRTIKNFGFKDFEVNEFVISKNNKKQIVTYWWYTSGNRQMASRPRHMIYMCLNGLIHGHVESGFVRVSTPVTLNNLSASQERIDDFCKSFVPILGSMIN